MSRRDLISMAHWTIKDMKWEEIFHDVDGGENAMQGKITIDGWEADFTIERENRYADYLIHVELITMNYDRENTVFKSKTTSLANVMIYIMGWVYMAKIEAERS